MDCFYRPGATAYTLMKMDKLIPVPAQVGQGGSVVYLPAQQAGRFPKNAEMPSWASAASEFMLMISLA